MVKKNMAVFSKQLCTEHEFLNKKLYLLLFNLKKQRQRKEKRKHRFWARSIFQRRSVYGTFKSLFQELKEDREQFVR